MIWKVVTTKCNPDLAQRRKKEKTKAKAIAEDSMNLPLYKRNMGMATHDKLTALEVYLDTGNPDAKVELSWKESNE